MMIFAPPCRNMHCHGLLGTETVRMPMKYVLSEKPNYRVTLARIIIYMSLWKMYVVHQTNSHNSIQIQHNLHNSLHYRSQPLVEGQTRKVINAKNSNQLR